MAADPCPDCGVLPGEFHRSGCDIEQCPYCGRQLIACVFPNAPPLDDSRPWTGLWPRVAECREFGWFARLVPGRGWVPCEADEEGAVEDLNRLRVEAIWDRELQRFVLHRSQGGAV